MYGTKNGRVDGDEWGVFVLEVEGDMVSNLLLPVSLCIKQMSKETKNITRGRYVTLELL